MFDDIVLPEGIDKNVLVNTILVESGDFEVLYDIISPLNPSNIGDR